MVGRMVAVGRVSLRHTRLAVVDKEESFYQCKLRSIEQSNENRDR